MCKFSGGLPLVWLRSPHQDIRVNMQTPPTITTAGSVRQSVDHIPKGNPDQCASALREKRPHAAVFACSRTPKWSMECLAHDTRPRWQKMAVTFFFFQEPDQCS